MMTEKPDRLDPNEVVPELLHAKTCCLWARGQLALGFRSKQPPQKSLHPILSVSRRVATSETFRGGPLDARGLKLAHRLLADLLVVSATHHFSYDLTRRLPPAFSTPTS